MISYISRVYHTFSLLVFTLGLSACMGGSGAEYSGGGTYGTGMGRSTRIEGQVTDISGTPLNEIKLEILETGDSGLTNKNGNYDLTTSIPSGVRTLHINFRGSGSQVVRLATGKIENIPDDVTHIEAEFALYQDVAALVRIKFDNGSESLIPLTPSSAPQGVPRETTSVQPNGAAPKATPKPQQTASPHGAENSAPKNNSNPKPGTQAQSEAFSFGVAPMIGGQGDLVNDLVAFDNQILTTATSGGNAVRVYSFEGNSAQSSGLNLVQTISGVGGYRLFHSSVGNGSIVIAANIDGTISTLTVQGGNFQVNETFQSGISPTKIEVADINGDGISDMLLAGFNRPIRVVYGKNLGKFLDANGQAFPTELNVASAWGTFCVLPVPANSGLRLVSDTGFGSDLFQLDSSGAQYVKRLVGNALSDCDFRTLTNGRERYTTLSFATSAVWNLNLDDSSDAPSLSLTEGAFDRMTIPARIGENYHYGIYSSFNNEYRDVNVTPLGIQMGQKQILFGVSSIEKAFLQDINHDGLNDLVALGQYTSGPNSGFRIFHNQPALPSIPGDENPSSPNTESAPSEGAGSSVVEEPESGQNNAPVIPTPPVQGGGGSAKQELAPAEEAL